jgi:surface antigen
MIGKVETVRWTVVVAELDGVPQPEMAGKTTERRAAQFAYRAEGEQWAAEQAAEGFEVAWFASAAVSYYGPTDAPGNCWSVTVERVAE